MELTEITDRVVHVRKIMGECSDLTDKLESALDSAESVCPASVLEAYAGRVQALATPA